MVQSAFFMEPHKDLFPMPEYKADVLCKAYNSD